jgi:hypothetical protein
MNRLYLKILTVLPLLHRSKITTRIPVIVRCVVHSYFDEFHKTYNQLKLLKFVISCHNSCHSVELFFVWSTSVELFFVWSRSIRLYFDFFILYWERMNRLRDFLHDMSVLEPSHTSLAKIDIAFSAVESGSFNVFCTAQVVFARHVLRPRLLIWWVIICACVNISASITIMAFCF